MNNEVEDTIKKNQSLTHKIVKQQSLSTTFYFTSKLQRLKTCITDNFTSLAKAFTSYIPKNNYSVSNFTSVLKPLVASGVGYLVGNFITSKLNAITSESEESEVVYQFLLGTAILGFTALNRLTENKIKSPNLLAIAIAADTLGIVNLTTSSFKLSRNCFDNILSDNCSLIASLSMSGLIIPGLLSTGVRKAQQYKIKKLYQKGSQRSDTALISAGMTPVSNCYFNASYFILKELRPLSRIFQIALIGDNILNAKKAIQKFRNFPALVADAGPQILKSVMIEYDKVQKDYKYNTWQQYILRFVNQKPIFMAVERYKLKLNDLVYCDKQFDMDSVPVSGEVIALEQDAKGVFTNKFKEEKYALNLKSLTGEDLWIEFKPKLEINKQSEQIDLHAVRDGKQTGVLVGAKLNLFGCDNFFIKIKNEKEKSLENHYEKTSIINDIITRHKKNNVLFAVVSSLAFGAMLTKSIEDYPGKSLGLLFNLFQMMIPFSESFLREMVNKKLLNDLNKNLINYKLTTIDALRVVDFCNMLNGYYEERFPKGMVMVSDKTGTLTTSNMEVVGIWTDTMSTNVKNLMQDQKEILLPSKDKLIECVEVFINAFTNQKKELEPEEHAILKMFKRIMHDEKLVQINTLGNQHFKKIIKLNNKEKISETIHLGLFRKLGGRLTLVSEDGAYKLLFCGIPKADAFKASSLIKSYTLMTPRKKVLTRDWCIAKTEISKIDFEKIKEMFYAERKHDIEEYLVTHDHVIPEFKHISTFLINNPVKKGAEHLIEKCRAVNMPVFIATGDTVKNAENVADVLCHDFSHNLIAIKADSCEQWMRREIPSQSTIIFGGINNQVLALLDDFMKIDLKLRPIIIFAEMSTEGKGILAHHLKQKGYFLVTNGDGSNDVAMMRVADMVIAHLTDDGAYAPGVEQFANLNDKQLQQLCQSQESFYDLFDIHLQQSQFIKHFTLLANSQEKPSLALILKSGKMSFELAKAVGLVNVKEMWQQHWCSILFDLCFLGMAYYEIMTSTNLPADDKHLGVSELPIVCSLTTISAAVLQSIITYKLSGESTNAAWMVFMLTASQLVLKNIFKSFDNVSDEKQMSTERPAIETSNNNFRLFTTNAFNNEVLDEKTPLNISLVPN